MSSSVIRCQSRLSFLTTIFRVLLGPKNYIKRTVSILLENYHQLIRKKMANRLFFIDD